ncbi:MAG: hypothetical protein HYV59_02985 [Planctomycetes bacterium]|nr:hypothetical protein [Planctomycetota bacterium]
MKNIGYKVPKENKEIFLCPALDRIPGLVQENKLKMNGFKLKINGIPFQALRNKTREELLRKAVLYTNGIKSLLRWQGRHGQHPLIPTNKGEHRGLSLPPLNRQLSIEIPQHQDELHVKGQFLDYESIKNVPIIQTGHEPILYHPGVWIKNHLIHLLAKRLGGIGVNMIVDNDGCNMGFMYVPILSEESASVGKVSLVKNKDHVAYEEIVIDDFGSILQFKEEVIDLLSKNAFREDVKTIMEDVQTMFEQFTDRIGGYYQQGCSDMVGLLTAARISLEEDFGIENLEIPISWMCDTDGFYHFLLHILYDAGRFAKIYNEKLTEYRGIHKIRSKANPLPDLKVLGDSVELPFWVWKAGGQRARCYALNNGDDIKITDRIDTLVILKKSKDSMENISRLKTLKESGFKIRPRAITTTMFSRLFFSDVFIHGIGGAKYDTITDEIIKEFFGIDPPGFVTISATLFLPFDAYDLDESVLYDSQRIIDDMRYNPERYAQKETQSEPEFMSRVEEKQGLLKMMAVGNAEEKRRYFNRIKELNKLMLSRITPEIQKKQNEMQTISSKLAYNEVVRFREYPVCLYSMKVLSEYLLNIFS